MQENGTARLNLCCECGVISWDIIEASPRVGVRYICHCDDCQAFAYFAGRPENILDENAGTDAYQLPASRIEFLDGADQLACVLVTPRPLLRWHCASCRTPVANTYHTSKLSFVSVPFVGASKADRDRFCGPPSGHVWTKFGRGDLSAVKQYNIPAMLWRMASRIIWARMSGDYKNNPFFRPDAKPIVTPHILSREDRRLLDEAAQTG